MATCSWATLEPRTELYGVLALASLPCLFAASFVKYPAVTAPLLRSANSPERQDWIDSARFVLITLVVIGHFIAVPCNYMAEDQYWLSPFLVWINLFTMQGFAVLSGFLSKGALNAARSSRLLVFVVLPYILSKLLMWVYMSYVTLSVRYFNPFDTFDNGAVQWYLACLVQWRILIEVLRPLGTRSLVACTLLAGFASGYWIPSGTLMAMQRVFAFFPFFVAGYLLDLPRFRAAVEASPMTKGMLTAVLFGSLGALFAFPTVSAALTADTLGNLDHDYTTNNGVLRELCGANWALSFVHRAIRYLLGGAILTGFIGCVPASPSWAVPGKATMYPYLIHPWIVDGILLSWMGHHPTVLWKSMQPFWQGGFIWLYIGLLAPVVTLALSSRPVQYLTGWIIEPTWAAPILLAPEHAALFAPKSAKPKNIEVGSTV